MALALMFLFYHACPPPPPAAAGLPTKHGTCFYTSTKNLSEKTSERGLESARPGRLEVCNPIFG